MSTAQYAEHTYLRLCQPHSSVPAACRRHWPAPAPARHTYTYVHIPEAYLNTQSILLPSTTLPLHARIYLSEV